MRIVFMGTPEFSTKILDAIKEHVVLVVTQPDKEVGRNKKITYSNVKEYSLANSLPIFQPINIKKDFQPILDMNPDLIITAAYGQIIPKEVLEIPCFNIHASLLPKYRGGSPIHYSIINGDEYTGITIMKMALKMDAGDILYQEKIKILDTDNTTILFSKLAILGQEMIKTHLFDLIGKEGIPQDESKVTFAFNLSREDEKINLNDTSKNIFNKIRGLSQIPGGYILFSDKKLKIFSSTYIIKESNLKIGQALIEDNKLLIKVKDGFICPLELQLEGKNKIDIKTFLNGYKQTLENQNFLFK